MHLALLVASLVASTPLADGGVATPMKVDAGVNSLWVEGPGVTPTFIDLRRTVSVWAAFRRAGYPQLPDEACIDVTAVGRFYGDEWTWHDTVGGLKKKSLGLSADGRVVLKSDGGTSLDIMTLGPTSRAPMVKPGSTTGLYCRWDQFASDTRECLHIVATDRGLRLDHIANGRIVSSVPLRKRRNELEWRIGDSDSRFIPWGMVVNGVELKLGHGDPVGEWLGDWDLMYGDSSYDCPFIRVGD